METKRKQIATNYKIIRETKLDPEQTLEVHLIYKLAVVQKSNITIQVSSVSACQSKLHAKVNCIKTIQCLSTILFSKIDGMWET